MSRLLDSQQTIRVGIIGVGFIFQVAHLANILRHQGVIISAVCDLRRDLVDEFSKRFNVSHRYYDDDDLINSGVVDAVIVVVHRSQTSHIVRKCLTAGLHVFSEKPMALSYQVSRVLVEIAKNRGVVYHVGFMRRHDPATRYFKQEILKPGGILGFELGQIAAVSVELHAGSDYCGAKPFFSSSQQKFHKYPSDILDKFVDSEFSSKYETFLNVCSHNIDLLCHLYDGHLNLVDYKGASNGGSLYFSGGAANQHPIMFNWRLSEKSTDWKERLVFYCDGGHITIDYHQAFLVNTPGTVKITSYGSEQRRVELDWKWSFEEEMAAFLEAVRDRNTGDSGESYLATYSILHEYFELLPSSEILN